MDGQGEWLPDHARQAFEGQRRCDRPGPIAIVILLRRGAGGAPDRMFRLSRALLSLSARASDPAQGPVWPPLLVHGNRRVALSQSADRQYRCRIDVVGIHHVGDALHRRQDHVLLPGFKMIEFRHELLLQQLGRIP